MLTIASNTIRIAWLYKLLMKIQKWINLHSFLITSSTIQIMIIQTKLMFTLKDIHRDNHWIEQTYLNRRVKLVKRKGLKYSG
jgi:hypothetical protein